MSVDFGDLIGAKDKSSGARQRDSAGTSSGSGNSRRA
jgi:hypothetical protein